MQHDFILLDRSGSMDSRWTEALSSINSYVAKLAEDKVDTGVTLATFDHDIGAMKLDIIRDRIIPSTWREVSNKDCTPRGGTPLNDAVVKFAGMALAGNYDKVAFIIMTDGEENSSREDRSGLLARKVLDDCRAKGWQVIMLGVDFDNTAQAASANNDINATVTVARGQVVNSMRMTSSKRAFYGVTGQSIGFTDEEKAELAKKP